MELFYLYKRKYLLFVSMLFFCVTGVGQKKSASPAADTDTAKANRITIDVVTKLRELGKVEAAKGVLKFNIEKEAVKQEHLLEEVREEMQEARAYIKAGIDTNGMKGELSDIKELVNVVADGVLINKGTSQTYRNLTTTSRLLAELLKRANLRKATIDRHEKTLVSFQYKIDSLFADPILYDFPKDSLASLTYARKLFAVATEVQPMDKALQVAISNANKLQTEVNKVVNKLTVDLDEIEDYQKVLSSRIFEREFTNLGVGMEGSRPFNQIVQSSAQKAELNLLLYSRNHFGAIMLVLLLVCGSTLFLVSLNQVITQESIGIERYPGPLVLRYPLLSAITMVMCMGQFIFTESPFVFEWFFWIIPAICLSVIFRNYISAYWFKVWVLYVVMFFVSCLDNMILQASRQERWGIVVLASLGVVVGILLFINGRREELKQKWILYFIALATMLELGAVFADVFGRYNLSKSLLIAGYLNVVIGILFLWTIRLINEGLYLASKAYTKQDRGLFYINFTVVGERAPRLFYLFLILGWIILFGRNFYVFKFISEPLENMFFEERTVGNYSFSISSLVIFVAVITTAIVVSKTVSYFTSENDTLHLPGNDRKAGIGSWILLIRVAIIGLGTFLAFAAAGIPTDRIALIIGALGVGIGFGLQTLVQNLVSGVIIAFEKPVNVGDIVEIGGQMGTMKSIGFRSSILSKMDGPDMVIPNGDLLNSHLTNWTLGGSKRQMDITVGVAYGTDLPFAQALIVRLLEENARIHQHPKPLVFFQTFGSSSIDMRVLFWVREFKEGIMVKSEVITAIDALFKEKGVVIPFPQQDVYHHNAEDFKAAEEIPKKKLVK